MLDSFREQTWNFISATFPERQIYIRADGRVQFFTFGPLMQAILAGISLIFLGWVAFTSVNVIFKGPHHRHQGAALPADASVL